MISKRDLAELGIGINYIKNGGAESGKAGWTTYADSAAVPVDGTGGSPNSTWTSSTSSPLRGAASFLFTKSSGASRIGEGAAYAFTIDSADQAKPLRVSFDYTTVSGTYVDDALAVYIYDVTNGTIVQPAPYTIKNVTAGVSQKWSGYFQTSAASTSYRLLIHVAVATDSSNVLKFDNFNVGPTYQSYGAVATDWVVPTTNYTPNASGWGTISSTAYLERREGDSIHAKGYFKAGTVAGASAKITMRTGLAIDTTKITGTGNKTRVGKWSRVATGSATGISVINQSGDVFIKDSDSTAMFLCGSTASNAYTDDNANTLAANSDSITFEVTIPISGWSSNVQVSSDADTREVSGRYENTAGTSITSSTATVPFATKIYDSHGAFNGSNQVVIPVPGKYEFTANIMTQATSNSTSQALEGYFKVTSTPEALSASAQLVGAVFGNGASHVQQLTIQKTYWLSAGDTVEVQADNSNTIGLNTTAGRNYFTWRRISGPAQIAASEKVYIKYTGNAGTALTANVTNADFSTKVVDSHGAWSGTLFTAPRASWYDLKGSTNVTAAGANWYLYVNGSQKEILHTSQSVTQIGLTGGAFLNAGDTMSVRPDATKTESNSATLHWISISSQGGI